MYHHQPARDSLEASEAIEAVEARDIEDVLDDIGRRETRRAVERDDYLLAAEVPAAWIGRGHAA